MDALITKLTSPGISDDMGQNKAVLPGSSNDSGFGLNGDLRHHLKCQHHPMSSDLVG